MTSVFYLPNKDEDERIIKVMRRDLFILFKKVLFSSVLMVVPVVLFWIFLSINPFLLENRLAYVAIILGSSAYYLFVWLFFFFSFIDYYLDVWIITNERIVDIQQKGFFSRVISEQRLFRVQDVTSEVHGFFPTMLSYGEVYIQTAASKQRFLFHEIPNPQEVRDIIIKLVERSKAKYEKQLKREEEEQDYET